MTTKVLDNRYKLIKVLGKGGFGRTYLARDMRRPGSPLCVVKQLKPASTDPEFIREARRLFSTEAETLERLGNHDQIPQLLAYFEEQQEFFLVQEYVEGIPLNKELETPMPDNDEEVTLSHILTTAQKKAKGKQLSESAVIGILKDILTVLEFVHSENVIHRDIKPDNLIRRAKDGKLVLIDFGAVRAMEDQNARIETVEGESRFTVTIGTPGYMSSEQCAGRPNYTSDLYAAGMVAIKALTGMNPHDIPSDPDTGELLWRDYAKISNGLAMVLTRMVRYRFSDRHQSVKEVQQALAAFLVPPETRPVNRSRSTSSAAPQRKSASIQSSAGASLLIIGLLCVIAAIGLLILSKPPKKVLLTLPDVPSPDPSAPGNPVKLPKPVPETILSQSLTLLEGQESQLQGSVTQDQVIRYTVAAKADQTLKLSMISEGALLEVLSPGGETLYSGNTGWEAILPVSGEYGIQVKPKQEGKNEAYELRILLSAPPADVNRVIEVQ